MRLICTALLCLLPTVGWSDDIAAASKVVSAKIFPAGAIVTRSARVAVPAGAHRIVVADMPRDLRVNSLQVGLGEPQGLVVRAMNFRERSVPPAPVKTPEMIAAERDLRQAEAARDALLAERAVVRGALGSAKLRITFLNTLAEGKSPPPTGDGGLAAGDLAAMIGEIGTQLAQATEDAAKAEAALAATARELAELQEAVERAHAALEAGTPLRRDTGTLVLDVEAETGFEGTLYLSYSDTGTGWRPAYEINLQQDAASGALRLIRQAVVHQQTREDWADVAVTLSTAALGQSTQVTIPRSTIYWLRDKDEIMPLAKTTRGLSADMAEVQMEPMMEAAPQDAFGGATTALRGQTLEFELGRVAALDGDGSEQLFRLDVIARDAALYGLANARRDSFAYLYTDLKNETGGTLLAGPAAIYRDGTLVGNTRVPQTGNGDIAKLPMGALNGLQLEHRVLQFEAGDSRFITAKDTRSERFEVLIDSYLDYAIDLTVYEALPVSEDEDLDVQVQSVPSPTEQSVEGRRGVVGWKRSIAAGASEKISYGWTLRWPEDRELMFR
jgi:uncharacterized protein (TIGR02231 family)